MSNLEDRGLGDVASELITMIIGDTYDRYRLQIIMGALVGIAAKEIYETFQPLIQTRTTLDFSPLFPWPLAILTALIGIGIAHSRDPEFPEEVQTSIDIIKQAQRDGASQSQITMMYRELLSEVRKQIDLKEETKRELKKIQDDLTRQ